MDQQLARKLQSLLDHQEIAQCISRYSRGIDRHDDALALSAYHDDALDRHGDFTGAPTDLIAHANGAHAEIASAHQHHITTQTIEIDGDVAHAESYCLGLFARADQPLLEIGGGRLIDRLERREGAWRIAARTVVVECIGAADREQALFAQMNWPTGAWDRTDPSYARPLVIALE